MKILHVFTEEASAKNVFQELLPKILPENVFFRIYSHQGKRDLEKALKHTLPSISRIPDSKILITYDQDSSDCKDVKDHLISLFTDNCQCDCLVRIVCKELESWFLGDLDAIKLAYPRFKPEHHQSKAEFRNVDNITQPNKLLLRIIPEYADRETLPKLETSENISRHMDISRNNSQSFNNTISAIRRLTQSN
jgi:hypothetical protein